MELSCVGTAWLCIAALCSGAASNQSNPLQQSPTQQDDTPEPTGHPITPTRDLDNLTTWTTGTPTPPGTGHPITTPLLLGADPEGNKTHNPSAVPVRYWAPLIFVVIALVVLFVAYRRKRGAGTLDPGAATASDSSDLGALDHPPTHDTTPIITSPQEERKGAEKPPAPQHTETTFCEPDPPPPQPGNPPADGGPCSSGEPGAD